MNLNMGAGKLSGNVRAAEQMELPCKPHCVLYRYSKHLLFQGLIFNFWHYIKVPSQFLFAKYFIFGHVGPPLTTRPSQRNGVIPRTGHGE